LPAGVLADAPGGVDDVELALLAAGVGRHQARDDLGRRQAFAQQREALRAIVRIDQRLGR
jgi:hypothetical protein